MKVLFIDLETTSLNLYKARICQIGLIWQDGEFIDQKTIMVNPNIPIPEECTKIHNITNEMVKDCPTMKEILPKLSKLINKADVIIGYNLVAYDIHVLKYEFLRNGYDFDDNISLVDVYLIWNKLEKKKLKNAYKRFIGEEMENSHDAGADILATKKVLDAMMKSYNFRIEDVINYL
jgi:DNA polymerase III subunit epsilon